MSDAEFVAVLTVGASVVQVIEGCAKVVSRVREYHRNIAFQDIANPLPLLSKDVEALGSPRCTEILRQSKRSSAYWKDVVDSSINWTN